MNTVLVTGATGFIGSHLVRTLRERDLTVRALVRSARSAAHLEALGVELIEADLTDPASLRGVGDGCDVVLHTACAVASTFDAGRSALEQFLAVNRDGTLNLARELVRAGGPRMVHVSSTAAMGTPATAKVDETTPCNPRAPYQISKREAELGLLALGREGLDVVILRPCVVAGEGKRQSELLQLFKMVRKGRLPFIGRRYDVTKPIIMVDDLVDAIILAAERGRAGEIYLVHSDGAHTIGEIIAVAGRLTGAKRTHFNVPVPAARLLAHGLVALKRLRPDWNPPLTPERVDLFIADRRIDITKARRELGYEPKHRDLDEMLGRTYRWYVQEGLL
jgi:dihydroflavonol-4-reductase